MTIQATTIAPTQTPYIFWLAAWHNLPIPHGKPCCCRITRSALEIDITPTSRWSIPLSEIVLCDRHVHHDGMTGLFLYARLTLDTTSSSAGDARHQAIYLGALDPIAQSWDWQETLHLITLINGLLHHKEISLHTNPYYRALERHDQLQHFSQIAASWDALLPPAHYEQHPLLQEIRRQSTRAIGIPLFVGLFCVLIVVLLYWLEASRWTITNSAVGLLPLLLASFWPDESYRHCRRMLQQVRQCKFLPKEVSSKLTG